MGIQVEDGQGTGYTAGVSNENRLLVSSVTSSLEHHANHKYGEAYNVLFSQYPDAAESCLFYIKNGSETDLCIEGVTLAVTAACEIYIEINNTGTPVTPTNLTPVNLNSGSGKSAAGTFQTGTDLQMDTGSEIERYYFSGEKDSSHYNFNQDVILPKNRVLTLWISVANPSADVPTVYGTFIFNYHSIDMG